MDKATQAVFDLLIKDRDRWRDEARNSWQECERLEIDKQNLERELEAERTKPKEFIGYINPKVATELDEDLSDKDAGPDQVDVYPYALGYDTKVKVNFDPEKASPEVVAMITGKPVTPTEKPTKPPETDF